jgi:hypothetical protein
LQSCARLKKMWKKQAKSTPARGCQGVFSAPLSRTVRYQIHIKLRGEHQITVYGKYAYVLPSAKTWFAFISYD